MDKIRSVRWPWRRRPRMRRQLSSADHRGIAISQAIEAQLEIDEMEQEAARPEKRVIMMGDRYSVRPVYIQMKLSSSYEQSDLQRRAQRAKIFNALLYELQFLIHNVGVVHLAPEIRESVVFICKQVHMESTEEPPLACSKPFQQLWADPKIQAVLNKSYSRAHTFLDYFFQDLNRVFQKDYVPSDEDVRVVEQVRFGSIINEFSFHARAGTYQVIELNVSNGANLRKWRHLFFDHDIDTVLYVVDVTQHLEDYEGSHYNIIRDLLLIFEGVVRSWWMEKAHLVLFFSNIDVFRRQLNNGYKIDRDMFPEYKGHSGDAEAALQFFTDLFMRSFEEHARPGRMCVVEYTHPRDHRILEKLVRCVGIAEDVWEGDEVGEAADAV